MVGCMNDSEVLFPHRALEEGEVGAQERGAELLFDVHRTWPGRTDDGTFSATADTT